MLEILVGTVIFALWVGILAVLWDFVSKKDDLNDGD